MAKKAAVWLGCVSSIPFVLSSCTSVYSVKRPNDSSAIVGIPYSLPQKTFLVSAKYTITQCEVKGKQLQVSATKQITITSETEPDPSERYYIPYSSLRNFFKDTDLTIQSFDNSTLKSMDATIADKTGPTITAVLGTALRIASLAGGVALTDAEGALTTESVCKADVVDALKAQSKQQAPGAGKTKSAAKPKTSSGAGAASAPQAASQPGNDSPTTFSTVFLWRPQLSRSPQSAFSQPFYPHQILKRWLTDAGYKLLNNPDQKSDAVEISDAGDDVILKSLKTELRIDLVAPQRQTALDGASTEGIILREPAYGLLQACDDTCPDPTTNGRTASEYSTHGVFYASEETVPQLGSYVILPLRNRMFETQTATIALSSDGAINKLGLKSNATAPEAASAVNTNLDSGKKALDARTKARTDAAASAANAAQDAAKQVTANNKAISDCLSGQKAVRDAGGTAVGLCQ
ncbi:hypothetical protein R69658_08044 [Paraburkholderia aspalathi]|uniref:Lipoprotein n=1 Tax=Paraburkholderia aspalathi TaxID=1324617 RepID=A0ABN7NDT6_9BURK|nr:hypothetical protein [Paraburkholderia aspalathi]MBK3824257.1 hypothetical protein [Paraburkholderia aspalathi]MBK3836103.1 hypothetical protein [Paraburkholderia aspalathi]MBK3865872.1 hypothetical protein [Paraburkholderia aspalathi]CAE6869177.1 hypothetical protein R69658_08044 [Paraburkholderia aspalathi]